MKLKLVGRNYKISRRMKKALVYKPENSVGKFLKKMVANGGTNPFFFERRRFYNHFAVLMFGPFLTSAGFFRQFATNLLGLAKNPTRANHGFGSPKDPLSQALASDGYALCFANH